jgi:nucleotide-binding universal stress UspA family protein
MKTLVIATDGSTEAREAVAVGVDLAAEEHAKVIFVHVLSLLGVAPDGSKGMPHRPVRIEDDDALQEAVEVATGKGVPCKLELLVGLPEDEVVALADSVDADLIVMGSRGLRPAKQLALGSISRAVLDRAQRPVLVVRSGASSR